MKDKLKQRVGNDRQEWDHYDTNLEELWGNIEAKLDAQEKKNSHGYGFWLKIAASVIIAFGIGWTVKSSLETSDNPQGLYALKDISSELAETEYYYASMISEKLQLIHTSNTGMDNLVIEDLTLLDSAYHELQQDLKDNADNEEVINAMIQNYRIKLQILEKVLQKISKEESKEEFDEINI